MFLVSKNSVCFNFESWSIVLLSSLRKLKSSSNNKPRYFTTGTIDIPSSNLSLGLRVCLSTLICRIPDLALFIVRRLILHQCSVFTASCLIWFLVPSAAISSAYARDSHCLCPEAPCPVVSPRVIGWIVWSKESMKKLKRAGEIVDPWGTPMVTG